MFQTSHKCTMDKSRNLSMILQPARMRVRRRKGRRESNFLSPPLFLLTGVLVRDQQEQLPLHLQFIKTAFKNQFTTLLMYKYRGQPSIFLFTKILVNPFTFQANGITKKKNFLIKAFLTFTYKIEILISITHTHTYTHTYIQYKQKNTKLNKANTAIQLLSM